ncbi:MAG: TIGR02594 family protein [Bacteroidota bacterium]
MTLQKYRVKAGALNVREAPTTRAALLGKLHKDDVIQRLDETDDGKWVKFRRGDLEGWCVKGFLEKLGVEERLEEEYPWMRIARQEMGVRETPGAGNNPRVVEYLKATSNLGAAARSRDETPWCSAFVNWCLKQAGIEGTRSALARSWLDWGEPVQTPRPGCIVVFSRERIFGHVGFYLGESDAGIKVLGGNQQDEATGIYQVSEKYYLKSALLGFRLPKTNR